MPEKYLAESIPPTCLHVLGQPLVNAIHKEGREMRAAIVRMMRAEWSGLVTGFSDDQIITIFLLKYGLPETLKEA